MKISSFYKISGATLGIAFLSVLLFFTYDSRDSEASLTEEARSMCRDSSEPESVYHIKDGWSREVAIDSHIDYYQEKLDNARGTLLYLQIVGKPVDKQLERVKTIAFVLSYWQHQYLLYYQDNKESDDNSVRMNRV